MLLPPQCLACRALVTEPGALCARCWGGLAFLAPPLCRRCGYPLEPGPGSPAGGEAAPAVCAACLTSPPRYDRARAVFEYGPESRGMILAFKHRDRTEAAPAFGRWLARAGRELLDEADLVAPVPLHYWRLLRRRYNQAAMLTQVAAALAGRPVVVDLLRRRRATPSQASLGAAARRRNVAGAFEVPPRHRDRVQDRRILLIDDVLTTGATVSACARALRQAGAAGVDVLTLARVVRPQRP